MLWEGSLGISFPRALALTEPSKLSKAVDLTTRALKPVIIHQELKLRNQMFPKKQRLKSPKASIQAPPQRNWLRSKDRSKSTFWNRVFSKLSRRLPLSKNKISRREGSHKHLSLDQICHLLKNPLRKAEDQNSRKNKLELAAWAVRENHKSQRAATKTSILKIKTNKASKNFKSIHPSTATS